MDQEDLVQVFVDAAEGVEPSSPASETGSLAVGRCNERVRGTRIELASIRVRTCCVTLTPTPHGVGRLGIEPSSRRVKAGCISLMLTSLLLMPGSPGLVILFHRVSLVGSGGIEPLAIGHWFTGSLDTMSWSGPETTESGRREPTPGVEPDHTAYEAGARPSRSMGTNARGSTRAGSSLAVSVRAPKFGVSRLAADVARATPRWGLVGMAARGGTRGVGPRPPSERSGARPGV